MKAGGKEVLLGGGGGKREGEGGDERDGRIGPVNQTEVTTGT